MRTRGVPTVLKASLMGFHVRPKDEPPTVAVLELETETHLMYIELDERQLRTMASALATANAECARRRL